MSKLARSFQIVILGLALILVALHLLQWENSHEWLFASYFALTAVTSLMRLGIPTAAGTISISFVFVLAGLAQLSLPQAVSLGVMGTVLHSWREIRRRDGLMHVGFHAAVSVLAVEAASRAFSVVLDALPGTGPIAGLPVAATALFATTAFPLAAMGSLSEHMSLRQVWKNRYLWSLPYYLAGAALSGLLIAVSGLPFWQIGLAVLPLLILVYRSYGVQLEALDRERHHAEELATLQMNLVEALALAVESKELTAVDQLHRMTVFSLGLGRACGLKDEQLRALKAAAVLHDIGQVAVPDHIIMKPGKLTAAEYERLKVHPEIGADIIDRAQFPYPVSPIVRAHHEKWDGTGYPAGLKGDQIPREARVLAAVDMLVALTSPRSYRQAMSLESAMAEIRKESGTKLDPSVVAELMRVYRELDEQVKTTRRTSAKPQDEALALSHEDETGAPVFLAKIAAARREEQSLLEFTQILGSSLNLDETMKALLRRFQQLFTFDTMVLYLRSDKDRSLTVNFVGGENYQLFHGLTIQAGDGASSAVAESRKAQINANPASEPLAARDPEKAARLHSMLSVPLEAQGGIVGVLSFYSERRNNFSPAHLSVLGSLTEKLALTVVNLLRHQQAESQATNDFLTGLPNAGSLFMHLQSELARCARTDSSLTVMVCDLDGFKSVNDRFGHLTGNKLLQGVAAGLKELCREYDFVARLGGDEFVIVLPGATDDAIKQRRRRFSDMVERCGVDCTGEQVVGMSSGLAFYPKDGRVAEELLSTADERMYEDKAARKAAKLGTGFNTAHNWLERQSN